MSAVVAFIVLKNKRLKSGEVPKKKVSLCFVKQAVSYLVFLVLTIARVAAAGRQHHILPPASCRHGTSSQTVSGVYEYTCI